MKNKTLLKLLKRNKSNSGFTLTELLTGLIMSGVVVGALGWGLMQILRTTSTEDSKINARSETSRALEFISEEIKRATAIESNANNANDNDATIDNTFDTTGKTVVLALDIPDITNNVNLDGDSDLLGSDDDPDTSERVVYYLKSASGTNWKGPQILYRWGPPLDENGEYTEGTWQPEALIDEIDDTSLSGNPCTAGGGTLSPSSSATVGFYACIENGNTAQLFFSGQVANAAGNYNDNYSTDTRVVARAKNKTVDKAEQAEGDPLYFRSLEATYHCQATSADSTWKMRTDFNNSLDPEIDPDNTFPWIHDPSRQSQPININTNNPLKISSSPVGGTDCDSRGNPNTNGTEDFSEYDVTVSHTIDFNDPTTFNGGETNQPDVTGDGYVMIYRKGSTINTFNGGYEQGLADQDSIGEFLYSKGYAKKISDTSYRLFNDSDTLNIPGEPGYDSNIPTSILLENNERIISVEVGQTDNGQTINQAITDLDPNQDRTGDLTNDGDTIVDNDDYYFDEDGNGQAHPGFDGQDSVFILSTDGFDP